MVKKTRFIVGGAALFAVASTASAQLVKQVTIDAGKGISFYIGSQQGTATFTTDAGGCLLTVAISPAPAPSGMSGMAGGMEGTAAGKGPALSIPVAPARPVRLATPDGQQLVFNCGPDGKKMFLDMPNDFKFTGK